MLNVPIPAPPAGVVAALRARRVRNGTELGAQMGRQAAAVLHGDDRMRAWARALHRRDRMPLQVRADLSGGDRMRPRMAPAPHSGALVGRPATVGLIRDARGHPNPSVMRDSAEARVIGPATTPQSVGGARKKKSDAPVMQAAESGMCGRLKPVANPESWDRRFPTT